MQMNVDLVRVEVPATFGAQYIVPRYQVPLIKLAWPPEVLVDGHEISVRAIGRLEERDADAEYLRLLDRYPDDMASVYPTIEAFKAVFATSGKQLDEKPDGIGNPATGEDIDPELAALVDNRALPILAERGITTKAMFIEALAGNDVRLESVGYLSDKKLAALKDELLSE